MQTPQFEEKPFSHLSNLPVKNSIQAFEVFWCCPITLRPMSDPVVTCDGQSFEKEAIIEWFEKSLKSPATNLELKSKQLIPNHTLRNVINKLNVQLSEYLISEERFFLDLQTSKEKVSYLESELAKQKQYNQILKEMILNLQRPKEHERKPTQNQKDCTEQIIRQFESKIKELQQKIVLLQQSNEQLKKQLVKQQIKIRQFLKEKEKNYGQKSADFENNQNNKKNYQPKIFDEKEIIKVSENQFIEMINIYSYFPNLQAIILFKSKIGTAGVKALAENNSKFPNLQTIDLGWNKINDAGIKAFIEKTSKFPKLQAIHLNNNQIGDGGVKVFAQNASKFPFLQEINLRYNQIGNAGVKALAENASKFTNLQFVHLKSNQIGDVGVKALAQNASKFPSLKAIYTDLRTIKK